MKHSARSGRFFDEARRFRLIFTCEDCVHFCPASETCGHGYPNEEHRRTRYESGNEAVDIVFCKEWECA